ncbi:glycosyltransferase family 57 protein [Moniliophthora roreri MCA 2997]|uniref:Alpha-1,3-glucosyltransferase n=1 Tax=Moniliophthora roreri (strain MCA 2997) TaxID=1381753 RepID=V2X9Q2_MONRO|nr:glycosyltransferase family 57 protein [Moniliophthora roreri MCA 2997]
MADFPQAESSMAESPTLGDTELPSPSVRKRKISVQASVPFPRHRMGSTSAHDGRRPSLTTVLTSDMNGAGDAGRQSSSSPDNILAPTPRRHLLSAHQSRLWLSQEQSQDGMPSPSSSRGVSPTSTTFSRSPSRNIDGLLIPSGGLAKRLSSHRSLGSLVERMNATPPTPGSAAMASLRASRLATKQKGKGSVDSVPSDVEDGMGRRCIRWMHKRGMKDWVFIGVLLVGVFVRFSIGLGSYSGEKTPPMYGDCEAQRHWMELTIHLPTREWYTFDLQYWGLDYPPLTAYHSWMCGQLGSWFDPSWFALDVSRGFESSTSKLFMRSTVVISDLLVYIPALYLFTRHWMSTRSKRTQELAFAILIFQPALLLVDFGHFQYNSVMLGLTILAIDFFASGQDQLGAVFFVLSLGFKQMALYYAPAIGSYLLAKCILLGPAAGSQLFVRLAFTTVITFLIIFLPFLPPFAPLSTILHPIGRIFPFARGLFEDKVANFWCASNVVFKWKNWASPPLLVKISTAITLLGFLPGTVVMLRSGLKLSVKEAPSNANTTSSSSKAEPTPLLPLLPYTLLNSSLSFFLFSFQVHEKTILLPLMPLTLLLSGAAQDSSVFEWGALVNNVAVFSMWPLLKRDGLGVPYLALLLLWNRMIGHNPLRFPIKNFVQLVSVNIYAAAAVLHVLEMIITPPERYPDLFAVLNVLVSTPAFVLAWLWSIKSCIEVSWAIGGLGGKGGSSKNGSGARERTMSVMSDASVKE